MKDTLIHFEANGSTYPMAFNINVLEIMQERYGSFTAFTKAISGGEPLMKDIKFIFTECINEGIDMENDPECQFYIKKDSPRNFITEKQVGRFIGGITEAVKTIKNLIVTSNDSGKEEDDAEKNLTAG